MCSDFVDITELVFCTVFGTLFFLMLFIEERAAKTSKKITHEIKIAVGKGLLLICFVGLTIETIRNINSICKVIPYFILLKGNEELIIINIINKKTEKKRKHDGTAKMSSAMSPLEKAGSDEPV
jgi:hypothetical protein